MKEIKANSFEGFTKNKISTEKIRDNLYNLEVYKNKSLITDKLYNKLSASYNTALACSKLYRNKILITGLINSGKTSFINTLLGKNILHTSILENSRWPIIIRYSDEE